MSDYPGIDRACLEISFDNGGVNCFRPVEQVQTEIDAFIEKYLKEFDLDDIDKWLQPLDEEEIWIVSAGEETERKEFMKMKKAPDGTDELLNRYFEEVC